MLYKVVLLAAAWTTPEAPRIGDADLNLLPPREVCIANRDSARQALHIIQCRESTQPCLAAAMCEARMQAALRFTVWDAAADARSAGVGNWQTSRLEFLRAILGYSDYYAGNLPSPVPCWAFPQVPQAP